MSATHTPEPWRLGFGDGSGMGTITTVAEKSTAHSGLLPETIARLHWGCGCCDAGEEALTDEARANGAHIIQAVNERPALLLERSALKAANAELLAALSDLIKKYEATARKYADAADLVFHASTTPCLYDLPDTGPMMRSGSKRHEKARSHLGPWLAFDARASAIANATQEAP
jgi:hypothetical protein